MNLRNYIIKNCNKKFSIRLKELAPFLTKKPSKAELKKNPVQYSVFLIQKAGLDLGLTILSGKHTRGHYHKRPLPEVYLLLKGKAAILLKNGKTRKFLLKKNIPFFVSGASAHRIINLSKRVEFITLCPTAAGHIYKKIKF